MSRTVTITVTDVNEAPTVMGAALIDHAENGTVLGTDAEAENQWWNQPNTPPPTRTAMTTLTA